MRFSVVIPAFNEGNRIAATLETVTAFFSARGPDFEVLVCEDGSADDTVACVQRAGKADARVRLLTVPRNEGKGAAVRRGVLASSGERILVTDADLSTPLSEISKLEAALDSGNDIAIGSRAAAGARLVKRQPLVRELAGRAGNLVIRLLCPGLWDIRDTQCGFKLFAREAAMDLFPLQRLQRFGFDVEVLHLARRAGFRIAEIPVTWAHGEGSKVKPRDYVYTVVEVGRIRAFQAAGRYGKPKRKGT
jgi:dolichyl-phosphate beta-glucosyltransferase